MLYFFFFKQKTAYEMRISDWSSDVCSSDLHWEDAFAVETNQRLLAALGHRWDDVRPLPAGWQEAGPATEARHRIVQYVCGSRLAHPLWTIKDPRMCLLAALWISALSEAGCSDAVLLLVRHPQEVAASLAAPAEIGRASCRENAWQS